MNKVILMFGNIAIENCKFHCYKNLILIDELDINKLLISDKVSSSKSALFVAKMMIIKSSHYISFFYK